MVVATVLIGMAWNAGQAADPVERPRVVTTTHDTDFVPSDAVVTPHVAFAKPVADTLRIKALFTVWAPSARQVIELKQRLDFDFDFVAAGRNNKLWRGSSQNAMVGDQAAEDEEARLAEMLAQPYDVIVIGAVPWAWYPAPIQTRILEQVEAGAGLVITPHKNLSLRVDSGPLAELQRRAVAHAGPVPDARSRTATLGKGRIAFVEIPYEAYYDDHIGAFAGREARDLEALARTMLWAAGKSPSPAVEPAVDVGINRLAVIGSRSGTTDVYRDLERMYPVLYGALPYEMRPYDSFEGVSPIRTDEVDGSIRTVYELPRGAYVVLHRELNGEGQVTGWRWVEVEVPGRGAVADLALQSRTGTVNMDTDGALAWVRPDRPVRMEARVVDVPEDAHVSLKVSDRENRVVAAARGPVSNGRFVGMLHLNRVLHDLQVVRVEAYARAGQRVPLAERRIPLLIDATHAWQSAHKNRSFGLALSRPELTGNQISYFPGYNVDYTRSVIMHAWCDIKPHSFLGQDVFLKSAVDEHFRRERSFHDPAFRARQRNVVNALYAGTDAPGHPGRVIVVNDEWCWGYVNAPGLERTPDWPASINQDRSPAALEAFREYLRDRYRDLERLNLAWGTAHTDWAQVSPHLFTGAPEEAPPEAVWPAIVDHFAFVNYTLTAYLGEVAAVARSINPRNEVSVSAFYSLGPLTGVDHYHWAQYAPHVVVYYDWALWQSFTDQTVGRWFGYGGNLIDPMNERFRAWKHLFRGVEGASWSREDTFFLPDHTLNPAVSAYYAELRDASRQGLIDLLKACGRVNPIGILYHPRSYFVHALKDWNARPDRWWKNIHRRKLYTDYLGRYIEEGLEPWEYRFVDIDQLAQDRYTAHGEPRVPILPLTEALDENEAAVLRRYVKRGGVLVGDLNTAMRSSAGRRLPKGGGALDEVFGIAEREHLDHVTFWRKNEKRPQVPLNFRSQDETQVSIDDVWPTRHAEDGVHEVRLNDGAVTRTPILGGKVTAAGAQSLAALPDGTPAFFVNPVGEGQAVYLNYIPWDRTTFDRLRAIAGVPGVRHTLNEGPFPIIESVREYDLDGHLYLGVLTRIYGFGKRWNVHAKHRAHRNQLADKSTALRLSAPAHVYDARRGAYLGYTDAIKVRFSPEWVANLYACLPYRVVSVQVAAEFARAPDGRPVIDYGLTVRTDNETATTHVLSLTIVDPRGREIREIPLTGFHRPCIIEFVALTPVCRQAGPARKKATPRQTRMRRSPQAAMSWSKGIMMKPHNHHYRHTCRAGRVRRTELHIHKTGNDLVIER